MLYAKIYKITKALLDSKVFFADEKTFKNALNALSFI